MLMVKRTGYLEHKAALKEGKLILIPEGKPVHWTEIESVRQWVKRGKRMRKHHG